MLQKKLQKQTHKKVKKAWKEIAEQLVISFFFASFIYLFVYLFLGNQINSYLSLVNAITVKPSGEYESKEVSFNTVKKRLNNRPSWGTIWASLEIPEINMKLPVYQGDTLDILRSGGGHFSASYFPGEGGSIILDAHCDWGFFYRIPELKEGSLIYLKTIYGDYTYKLERTKIIGEDSMDDMPIQNDEEILMMYTCYPVNTIGHKSHRYVVYARLVEESHE